ncbi:reticulocyte-binding protein homolog 1-like [Centruroides vittatus]|uniref:reticulocyte-binding protein homolog 1-like n=1 Tax=Centruroides vittatus TaxID=120091 RepID=UPI00350F37C9
MEKDKIIEVIKELIQEGSYEQLNEDPVNGLIKALDKELKNLKIQQHITEEDIKYIKREDNRTPKFNIRVKTHKNPIEYRPLIDVKNYIYYNLEKYLKNKLNLLEVSKYSIKNVDELLSRLKNITINENLKLISLDVVNMYPSITIEDIENSLINIQTPNWIIKLCLIVIKNNYFQFDKKFYTQTEGIPMSTCIGPKLAEISMLQIDEKIKNIEGIGFYSRYVDDCIIIFDKTKTNENIIVNMANKIKENIKFELVKEKQNSLNYLDVTIERKNDRLVYKKYVKLIQIPKIINYKSVIPVSMKYNIFKMYMNKIRQRTCEIETQKQEEEEIIKMFILNDYPKCLLNKWNEKLRNDNQSKPMDKEKKFVKLRKEENYDITEEKGVVYSFNCNCNPKKTYIGETKRKLKIRLSEHIKAIKGNYANSAVAEHCNKEGCEIDLNTVKIRKKEENNFKRQLYEHINITRQTERINKNKQQKFVEICLIC